MSNQFNVIYAGQVVYTTKCTKSLHQCVVYTLLHCVIQFSITYLMRTGIVIAYVAVRSCIYNLNVNATQYCVAAIFY